MKKGCLSIKVGPFSIGLTTDDEKFCARLAGFYQEFLTEQEPILTIQTKISQEKGEIPALPTINPDKIVFDAPGYRGELNWFEKSAFLELGGKEALVGCDYFLRVTVAVVAYHAGGILFHAAGVEREGKAYLFIGHSGAGKTTTARNSPPGSVLNDDLLILYPSADGWVAYATPFYNPTQVRPRPGSAPIQKILYLVKDQNVYLEEIPLAIALAEMIACVPVLTASSFYLPEILKRCNEILATIPYYHLHLLPDDSYWKILLV
ncbi:MAG: hypothetical protein ANABAC_1016 [Anaerolineae bacterium]|jgi:hypothetical protein|nr:MAG: hypothetical protein ANABAC_1016 [Anaerolineae bacterium]